MKKLTESSTRRALVIIDPQNSFCHPTEGELYVPGAEHDMERLAALIEKCSDEITEIHVTLDTHHELDVAHPIFWVDQDGNHPATFTTISRQAVLDREWMPFDPQQPCALFGTLQERMINYVTKLEENGRYQLTIWPPHCRIGTPGHNVYAPLSDALRNWEHRHYIPVNYILKGSNIFTEHYSGIEADVPDPNDSSTQINLKMIQTLQQVDLIVFSGEASSHCVANTVRDMVKIFNEAMTKKCVLLEDGMSPVAGFESFADAFFQEMSAKGMQRVRAAQLVL